MQEVSKYTISEAQLIGRGARYFPFKTEEWQVKEKRKFDNKTDNPVNESLIGWIKEELFIDFNLAKSSDVHNSIKDYVHYYNNERFSYALKYITPVEFKSQLGIV